jgi:hypothetical protein
MALVLADRVRETTAVVGTGTATLLGAIASYQSFAAIGNGNTVYYTIVDQSTGAWEVGIGTYTASGTTLSRDTVLSSSNAGSLVNFSAGTKDVWGDYPAGKAVTTDTLAYPPAIGGTTPAAGTFTPLTVYQATTATKATGLGQWNYSGKSISVSAQETASSGLFFRDDGTRMFVVGSTADTVFQYNLGTAWDVTTATFTVGNSLLVSGQDTAPSDIFFKPDGLAFYLLGDTNNSVFQYTIGTAWTINTGAYASKSFSVAAQETTPTGLWFRPDGSTMYIVGQSLDNVVQYSLGTAWDVTTATFVRSFSIAAQDGGSGSLVFNPTGTSFYITGVNNDNINQYNLGTAWDISTAVFVPDPFHVGAEENNPTGLFIDFTANNRAYVSGSSSDAVFQYNTATTSVSFVSDRFNWNGNYNVTGNSYFNGALDISGTITAYGAVAVSGTLTASGSLSATTTISLSGSTTSTTGIGTAATTGVTNIGGTTQTGAITFGQSTAAQTANIATGATATATTKTVNIGTAGLSGSTTNINIGSAVSGAAGTITFSSGGTQMAVTNTASAVNYVQVTGAATGAAPSVITNGSDANAGLSLSSRGTGTVSIFSNSANVNSRLLDIPHTGSVVNRFQLTGSITGNGVALGVNGSDTNISQVFQSKGTGAIDLAAGSSGVNISNGGTVTAITRTAAGSGYTTIPSVAVSAPTTAGGVQAVVTVAQMQIAGATIQSGGTGYTVGDTLTIVGGTPVTSAATLTVATVSAGVITGVNIGAFTNYTVLPTNPVSVTGGTGSGATFNVSYAVISFTIGTAGSGYVEQPTVTFSGGGGSGAAAYATVGSGTVVKTLGSTMLINTPGGTAFGVTDIANSVNYIRNQGSSTGFQVFSTVQGTDTNTSYAITSKGNGAVSLYTNLGNQLQFTAAHTASAVNYVQVTGAATGSGPVLSIQGSDTNAGLAIRAKGSGFITLGQDSTSQFGVSRTASAVNYLLASGSTAGNAITLSSFGSDTNISQVFQSKGTGAIDLAAGSSGVNISNGGTVTAITGVTGGSYTTVPTVTISPPTTGGGVQATATVGMASLSTSLAGGGTGYSVNDVLTFVGGTASVPINVTVNTVSAGVILTYTVNNGGTYTVLPTNPISVTGGTGAGATFNVPTWQVRTTAYTITNAGSGYVEQPTITFSSGSATAYASVGAGSIIRSLGSTGTQSLSFYVPSGEVLRLRDTGTTGVYMMLNTTSSGVNFIAQGATNAFLGFNSNGTSAIQFGTNGNTGTTQMQISHTASAVNYVQVTGSATNPGGSALANLQFTGSDTNVNGAIVTKGTGYIAFAGAGSTGTQAFRVITTSAATAGNLIAVQGAAAGSAPSIQAISGTSGTDTDIDLTLTPKGTGNVRFGTFTANMALTIQGYVEIKDAGGTVRRLAVIA